MSNRNFDFSAIVKILNAQNNANFYNRQQTVVQRTPGIPYTIDLQAANPQTGNYDADTIATLQAGQQAYYFKGVPDTTVLAPQQYTAAAPPAPPTSLYPPVLTSIINGNENLSVSFTQEIGTLPITNYQYTVSAVGGKSVIGIFSPAATTSPVLITGLVNGITLSITLQAISDTTTSVPSNSLEGTPTASALITPVLNYALPNDESAYVYFTIGILPPGNGFQYTTDGGVTYANVTTGTDSPALITGLTNGVATTIQFRTVDGLTASTPSNAVTVTPVPPSVADSWLEYDPNNSSSYSGSGTTLFNVGSYGTMSGTLQNGITYITGTGISRNVFNLNGSSQYISFGTFDFGTAITVTAWIRPTTKNNINNLLANGPPNPNTPGFKMNWNSYNPSGADGAMVLENGTVGTWALPGTGTGTVTMGVWQHLVYVLDVPNRAALFFLNGLPVPYGYGATVANVTMAGRAFNIGAYSGGGFTPRTELGYLKVFNTVLDATQILADYNDSKASFGL